MDAAGFGPAFRACKLLRFSQLTYAPINVPSGLIGRVGIGPRKRWKLPLRPSRSYSPGVRQHDRGKFSFTLFSHKYFLRRIEISEEYCAIAKRRLAQGVLITV